MTLGVGELCPICGAPSSECDSVISDARAVDFRGGPVLPRSVPGRTYVTPVRIFRHERLLYGVGQSIPWAEAVALGLIDDAPEPEPVVVAFETVEPDDEPEGYTGESEGAESEFEGTTVDTPPVVKVESADAPAVAAVRRRSTKRRGMA